MAFYLDAGLIVLALLFVLFGFYRGLVKSLVELGGILAAVFASVLLASFLAPAIYSGFIKGPLTDSIQQAISTTVGADVRQQVQGILDALPNFVANSLPGYGITSDSISGAMAGSAQAASAAVAELVAPIVTDLIKTILMLVLFLLLMVLVKLAARAIDKVFHLLGLRQVNVILGAVFGILKGAVFVMLLCAGLKLVIPMLSSPPEIFAPETIESTVLFQHIYNGNPVYGMLEFV